MRDEPEGGAEPQPLGEQSPEGAQREERTSRLEVFVGRAFSNLVMFAVIVATAQTPHSHNITNSDSAAEAAKALKPFAGHFASALFALGFIGSGLLAIPVLAGAVPGGGHVGFERSPPMGD
jgi:Mn2+/Fe2+ NRAMP family transporter